MACALEAGRMSLGVSMYFANCFHEQTGHVGGSWNMMASCGGSCIGKKPEDLSWFKISEDNYDPTKQPQHPKPWTAKELGDPWPTFIESKTGVEIIVGIARKFTLPTKLPGGEYLLSCTLLAVHSFDKGKAAPQYYPTA
jgi:hypothetical protein